MTEKSSSCCGGESLKLIFACGGAADVGELADRVARKLNRDGIGKMYCIVGIGGKVSGILETTRSAKKLLAIDGCPLQCVKSSLDAGGFNSYIHLKLWELGIKKGQTEVTEELVNQVAAEAQKLFKG
ncbi:MAG: putative zinc-binding protein [Victivallaceae bacterium]|nr:putative zinc-binding protein [Victivallaceae bacterium]